MNIIASSRVLARHTSVDYEAIRAAELGNIQFLEERLNTGLPVDIRSQSGYSLLARASVSGQDSVIEYLLNRGAEIDATNLYGETPLILAVQNGHLNTVRVLLTHGADTDIRDRSDRSPLLYALVVGREDIARLLIDADASVEAFDGEQALLWGVLKKSGVFIEYLLERRANPDAQVGEHSALDIAIESRSKDAVISLIKHNAKFSGISVDRALAYAAGLDIPELIYALNSRGVELNLDLYYPDETALQLAIVQGSERAFHALLDVGADPNARRLHKVSPLALAVLNRRPMAWIRRLENAGANMGELHHEHNGPLYLAACIVDRPDIAEYLLRKVGPTRYSGTVACLLAGNNKRISDSLLDSQEDLPDRAMQYAIVLALDDPDKFSYLISRIPRQEVSHAIPPIYTAIYDNSIGELPRSLSLGGAVDDGVDPLKITPLMFASMHRRVAAVGALLANGADANVIGRTGWTALMYAARHGDAKMVEMLLDAGAEPALKNQKNQTALDIAVLHGHDAVIGILNRLNEGAGRH